MRVTDTSTYQKSLANIAKLYAGLQRSVTPIHGDRHPERAKISATNWKIFQMRIAPAQLIDHWFLKEQHGGLAIVTGRISNLVVIDFDTEDCEEKFRDQFPHLLNTRIIQSAGRGLSHYYYSIPSSVNLPTLHMDGADLLSDGAYIIAPPTIINGNAYEVVQGGREYQLTPHDANSLLKFFKECNGRYTQKVETGVTVVTPPNRNKLCNIDVIPEPSPVDTKTEHCSEIISPESLVPLYQHYAPQIGRNNALFKVACHGRDHKLSQLDVNNTLKIVHANQLSSSAKPHESYKSRLREAEKTIASVFSQPPKPLPQQGEGIQLTNSIREALLKQGLTCVARVLDGLFLKGFKPGDVVTKKLVEETLQGQVGRYSILKTFSAVLSNNQAVFEKVDPSPRTPTHTSVAIDRLREPNKKCFLFSPSKSDKNSTGRIPTQFRLPDINALCGKLGVPFTRSDMLEEADIQQAKTYRQAIHRELIKRRPGMYFRQWLASRIGVSERTSQRYDIGADIQKQAMYIREPITWDNVDRIPLDDPIEGRFLEGTGGKRYPPLRQIAMQLLAKKQTVNYCYQDANYYWYGDNLPIISVRYGENPKQPEHDERFERMKANIKGYWEDFKAKKHVGDIAPAGQVITRQQSIIEQIEPTHDVIYPVDEPYQPQSKRFYKKALPDYRAESLAQRLYQAVWDRATSEKSRLSLANARRLIDEYSDRLVHRVLGLLKHRQNISNPAGFVIIWLRSTAKA